jgi:hypothetical protein
LVSVDSLAVVSEPAPAVSVEPVDVVPVEVRFPIFSPALNHNDFCMVPELRIPPTAMNRMRVSIIAYSTDVAPSSRATRRERNGFNRFIGEYPGI